jgi:ribulose 1,5-bisphosphate carboxylase large subunit-like protein
VHGHPLGSGAGARAAWQSISAVMRGLSLNKAIKLPEYKELAQAIEYWGKI